MISFFEKLKKGMGLKEELQEEVVEEKPPKIKKVPKDSTFKLREEPRGQVRKIGELKIKLPSLEPEVKVKEIAEAKETEEKIEISPIISEKEEKVEPEKEKKWFQPEGELAIDVYQTETDLVIQSAIAGVKPEDLDISIEKDILTIKGNREKPFIEEGDYFIQECYWGPFFREIILPVEIDPDRGEATMKEGILTIRLPKILREKKRRIKVRI